MKVAKVITRFAQSPSDPTELRRVARSLGGELSNPRVDTLRQFRTQIANTPLGYQHAPLRDDVSYAAGYVDSMLDLTAECESAFAAQRLGSGLPSGVSQGIRIAIELFQHQVSGQFDTDETLESVAADVLLDPAMAEAAVKLWYDESRSAGLIHEPVPATSIPQPMLAAGSAPIAMPVELIAEQADDGSSTPEPMSEYSQEQAPVRVKLPA